MVEMPLHDYEIAGIVLDRMRRLVECEGWCKQVWLSEFARFIELTGKISRSEGFVSPNKGYEARKAAGA